MKASLQFNAYLKSIYTCICKNLSCRIYDIYNCITTSRYSKPWSAVFVHIIGLFWMNITEYHWYDNFKVAEVLSLCFCSCFKLSNTTEDGTTFFFFDVNLNCIWTFCGIGDLKGILMCCLLELKDVTPVNFVLCTDCR